MTTAPSPVACPGGWIYPPGEHPFYPHPKHGEHFRKCVACRREEALIDDEWEPIVGDRFTGIVGRDNQVRWSIITRRGWLKAKENARLRRSKRGPGWLAGLCGSLSARCSRIFARLRPGWTRPRPGGRASASSPGAESPDPQTTTPVAAPVTLLPGASAGQES